MIQMEFADRDEAVRVENKESYSFIGIYEKKYHSGRKVVTSR